MRNGQGNRVRTRLSTIHPNQKRPPQLYSPRIPQPDAVIVTFVKFIAYRKGNFQAEPAQLLARTIISTLLEFNCTLIDQQRSRFCTASMLQVSKHVQVGRQKRSSPAVGATL